MDSLYDGAATCLPSWHTKFGDLLVGRKYVINSGCPIQANYDVPCDPEMLRKQAEDQLKQWGYLHFWSGGLSLEAYTLARYMASEVGSSSIETRVAVGYAAINQAKRRGMSNVNDLLLYLGPHGGRYGAIQSGTTGRWAATSQDPSLGDVLLARWIFDDGGADGWSRGGDDQDGIEVSSAFPNLSYYLDSLTKARRYWVGPLAGVDYWTTFVTVNRPDIDPDSDGGKYLVARAQQAIANTTRPSYAGWPVCADRGWLLAAGIGFAGVAATFMMSRKD